MDGAKILPPFFESQLSACYNAEDARRIIEGSLVRRATTLRANTLLSTRDAVAKALDAAGVTWDGVSWYEDAFVLKGAGASTIRALGAYDEGALYLQSLSSMMPALVLDAQPGEDVCDMCAAPGGKTTQIAALTQGKAYVTACEMHAPRAEKLEYNLRKLGAKNVTVMRTDARRLDDFFSFDRILIDAPCSGSGTLNVSSPKLAKRFTPALVEKCRRSQRALLSKGLGLLRPGGTLVYSTCSVLACENDEIVEDALRNARRQAAYELKPVELPCAQGLPLLPTKLQATMCICPTDCYEGFYIARIKRTR